MNNLVSVYMNINFILVVGFISFFLFSYRNRKIQKNNWNSNALLFARASIVVAIMLPVLMSLLPKGNIFSTYQLENLFVPSEVEVSSSDILARAEVSKETVKPREENFSLNPSVVLWAFFVLGFSISLSHLFHQIWRIHRTLRNSILHKWIFEVRIFYAQDISVPFSFLSFKGPVVVLPDSIIPKRSEKTYSLKHELQHIRQNDIYWAMVMEVLKTVFWMNPAIYLWKKIATEISEVVCDDNVLFRSGGKPLDYAKCLLYMAEQSLNLKNQPQFASGMASVDKSYKQFLSRRIDMIINRDKKHRVGKSVLLYGVLTLVVIISLGILTQESEAVSSFVTHPEIQIAVDDILKEGIEQAKAQSGFAIVSDPNSGEVLAISSFSKISGQLKAQPKELFLNSSYEPYSQIKPIIAAIALENGVMNENTKLDARGGVLRIQSSEIRDWKDHGVISFTNAIAQSSNIGVYRIAKSVGENHLNRGFSEFGLDNIQSITDGDEDNRLILISIGMGGVMVTPIQLIQAFSAIANGGKLMEVTEWGGSKNRVLRQVLSKEVSERMKQILFRVVSEGTGKWAQSSKYAISGKTASGYVDRSKIQKGQQSNRAQFVGFAPQKSPQLVAHVVIDHPKGAAHGGRHAAPVVRSIINKVLEMKGVAPDQWASAK